jgi:hypothetical protein
MTPELSTPPADWNDTLRSLEEALITGDAEQVASIAVAVTLGPVPASLEGRARDVLDGIDLLERSVEARMAEIAGELDRLPARHRRSRPPAPSQLDCEA